MDLLKHISKRQNIYTVQNNSKNEKHLQVYHEKYKKCPVNYTVNNARVIYLVHDHLDLTTIYFFQLYCLILLCLNLVT